MQKGPPSRSHPLRTGVIMRCKRQNGPGAGRDLKAEIPDQTIEPTQKPSDFYLSNLLSDDVLLNLFSNYNKKMERKVWELEQKIDDLEDELQTVKRYQQNGWSE